MSYFAAEVVALPPMEKHSGADSLSIFHFEHPYRFTYVGRTEDWQGQQKAVFVPVDAVVSDRPEFEFLGKHKRIKARKLRGVFSMGLLIPAKPEWEIGRDVTEELGITKYEDTLENNSVQQNLQAASGPRGEIKYTDIESLRRYPNIFVPGEEIVCMEKIEGENARFCFQDNRLFVGSRTRWLKENDNTWWKNAFQTRLPEILPSYPDKIFFGESYGCVKNMSYGMNKGQISVRFFDIYDIALGHFLNFDDMISLLNKECLEIAPIVYRGPWTTYEEMTTMAEGKSLLGHDFMEGLVYRPDAERFDYKLGRVITKFHSEKYLLHKSKKA